MEFVTPVNRCSMAMLDMIVMMDEMIVSYHMPEMKKASKQWIKKGLPGPIKAKVHASRTKQMLLAFFTSKGLIYTHIIPRGSTINANYILKAMGKFLVHLKKKRPEMVQQEWFFPYLKPINPHLKPINPHLKPINPHLKSINNLNSSSSFSIGITRPSIPPTV
jgi:hypothetical protein